MPSVCYRDPCNLSLDGQKHCMVFFATPKSSFQDTQVPVTCFCLHWGCQATGRLVSKGHQHATVAAGRGGFPILASISIWGVVNIRGSAVELVCDTCLVLRLPSKPSTSPQKGTGNFGGAQQYWAPNCSWGAAIR